MATTKPITINVDPEVARIFHQASAEERRKLALKFTLQVLDTSRRQQSLEDLAREVSRKARTLGLTPETLEDILSDEG